MAKANIEFIDMLKHMQNEDAYGYFESTLFHSSRQKYIFLEGNKILSAQAFDQVVGMMVCQLTTPMNISFKFQQMQGFLSNTYFLNRKIQSMLSKEFLSTRTEDSGV